MKKIGFIGVGIMGKSMVRNLMKNGFEVSIFARNKEKVLDVISEGANFYPTIKECVSGCDAVITIVGFPKDVEEVYFGENGILENVKEGTYVIDMTTSSPKLAVEIFEKAKEKGVKALDAPVTGGDIGAKNGTLTILVGGEEEDYKACLPIFQAMGTNIHYEGKAGFGQHTKLANQIMIAGAISGVCEAMAYAKDKGLDVKKMLDSVSTGAAGSKQLELVSPKILEEDFAPGFFIKHFIKDMKLAKEEALADNVNLDIEEKKSLVILGRSGVGKSVLIRIISTLLKPDEGSIKINGKNIIGLKERERFDLMDKFGFLFQNGALFDSLKVWENVAFKLINNFKILKSEARKIAEQKLEIVDLNNSITDLYPQELSGGMQKRVALARAIACDPEIIFFDEPTTGLDPITADKINDLIIKTVSITGATAITITHDIRSAKMISDRIVFLNDGKICWDGNGEIMDKTDNEFVRKFLLIE